jgi:stage V sporulation protein D (sporulation-specific penicillin-binding protein)
MAASKINMRRKMTLVLIVGLVCFVAVVIKLVVIQFVQGNELQILAEQDRTRGMTVDAARGTIYDANGSKLAISITADSIVANPLTVQQTISDGNSLENTASFLAGALNMDYQKVHDLLSSDQSYVYISRKVDFEVSKLIQYENLPGIQVEEEMQRFYPRGTLAAHVLGAAGIDNQGLWGIEQMMDDYLSGTDGSIVGQYDALNQPLPQAESQFVEPKDGYDVYLTIDENIQYFCERDLAKLMAGENPPKQAGIIIMDPKTGKILAMACTDPYDPNNYYDYPESTWRNMLVSDSYEPGSTFKIVTASTALEEGTVNTNSSFYCPGSITVANATIRCWSNVPHGSQTLAEAVQNSCNPAFVTIGQSIEAKQEDLFYKYIQAFGYGSTTGVDLNGEATGILQAEENVNAVEVATIAIGQGIAVTPMQMITAVSAVANDGVLLKPQIVSKVMDGSQLISETEPEVVRQVIAPETAQLLRQLLVGVVTDGSGANAAIEGYTIAGKTGTAQKPGSGGYVDGKYVASFVGMVPAELSLTPPVYSITALPLSTKVCAAGT